MAVAVPLIVVARNDWSFNSVVWLALQFTCVLANGSGKEQHRSLSTQAADVAFADPKRWLRPLARLTVSVTLASQLATAQARNHNPPCPVFELAAPRVPAASPPDFGKVVVS